VVFLDRLNESDSRDAILEPIRSVPPPIPEDAIKLWEKMCELNRDPLFEPFCKMPFAEYWIELWKEELAPSIISRSGGYPYFIQFICREYYDLLMSLYGIPDANQLLDSHVDYDIVRKLDNNFYAGRWARTTDRQRELLGVIASLDTSDEEFTVQEIVAKSKGISVKPFRASHVSQMLHALCDAGLVYKNRHGKYSFAVPLLGRFILRQQQD